MSDIPKKSLFEKLWTARIPITPFQTAVTTDQNLLPKTMDKVNYPQDYQLYAPKPVSEDGAFGGAKRLYNQFNDWMVKKVSQAQMMNNLNYARRISAGNESRARAERPFFPDLPVERWDGPDYESALIDWFKHIYQPRVAEARAHGRPIGAHFGGRLGRADTLNPLMEMLRSPRPTQELSLEEEKGLLDRFPPDENWGKLKDDLGEELKNVRRGRSFPGRDGKWYELPHTLGESGEKIYPRQGDERFNGELLKDLQAAGVFPEGELRATSPKNMRMAVFNFLQQQGADTLGPLLEEMDNKTGLGIKGAVGGALESGLKMGVLYSLFGPANRYLLKPLYNTLGPIFAKGLYDFANPFMRTAETMAGYQAFRGAIKNVVEKKAGEVGGKAAEKIPNWMFDEGKIGQVYKITHDHVRDVFLRMNWKMKFNPERLAGKVKERLRKITGEGSTEVWNTTAAKVRKELGDIAWNVQNLGGPVVLPRNPGVARIIQEDLQETARGLVFDIITKGARSELFKQVFPTPKAQAVGLAQLGRAGWAAQAGQGSSEELVGNLLGKFGGEVGDYLSSQTGLPEEFVRSAVQKGGR